MAGARDDLAAEVADLPDGPVRAALGEFLARWTGDATTLSARYVETFDLRRRASLYLTYYAHGDTRERGNGADAAQEALPHRGPPDGLGRAARPPDRHARVRGARAGGQGEALLAEHRPAIELLRLSLHDLESPYAHVLDAIAACLPALTVTDRGEVARLAREGPPEEAVGLEPYGPPEAMPEGAHA